MTRILPTLASFSLMLFAAAIIMGLTIGDLYADPIAEATLVWRTRHMLTGIAAALAVTFVECIVVTYFVGTGRWCKEVTETYQLPTADLAESNRLKRRTFPLALVGMLTVVLVSAYGAAADLDTPNLGVKDPASWHLWFAFGGFCVVAWTYYAAWLNVAEQQAVIARIVAQVGRIRAEMGLDEDPTAGAVAAGVAERR